MCGPMLSTLARACLSPLLLLLKYNLKICFTDNVLSVVVYIVMGYAAAQRTLEAQLDIFRYFHRLERKPEKEFPSWLKKKCPTLAYDVVSAESADGTSVALHVVKPSTSADTRPVLVCFHGGGMCSGSPLDKVFQVLVERYGHSCTLIAPDYRLAFEGARWPAGVEDCMTAVRHAASHTPPGSKLLLTGPSA